MLTDLHHQVRQYRQFTDPGKSSVTMTFGQSGAEHISQINMEIKHHMAEGQGTLDVFLNDHKVCQFSIDSTDKFERFSFNFHAGHSNLKASNSVKIQLGENSPAGYCLSDVTISLVRLIDTSGKTIFCCTNMHLH